MQENDLNIVRPVQSLNNIADLKPVKRRNQRKRRLPEEKKQNKYNENEQRTESEQKRMDDSPPHTIDYTA